MTAQDQQSRAAPPWWRRRADEIEMAVAAGKMSAAACFTQMLQILDAEQRTENVREGEPYDNPAFEDLARTMGVWGTAQGALCAQFFIAGRGAVLEGVGPVAWIDLAAWPPIRWPAGKVRADFRDIDGMALYTAAQVLAMLAQGLAPGWQAMPVEPTNEMLDATCAGQHCSEVYSDMLAAAPRPPAAQADIGIPTSKENQQVAAQERKPLTPNEVSGLLESAGYWQGDSTRADFINGLRHGEMAHGITHPTGD